MNIKERFGNRIRSLRKERGWSQEQFALECGLDRTYVGGLERGERNISLVNIEKSSIEKCSKCVKQRVEKGCFIRLLGLFDSSFTVYPHQGQEFGDFSKVITLDHEEIQMIIMCKSSSKTKNGMPPTRKITFRGTIGKDIYTQFRGYCNESAINLIGIMVPQPIEEKFRRFMTLDAMTHKKKILFIGPNEIKSMIYSVAVNHGISIEDI